ncbi:MAG: sigma factor [Bacteroidetes bacterium]|nr:sigma factor [Bacteroidota bacterium]
MNTDSDSNSTSNSKPEAYRAAASYTEESTGNITPELLSLVKRIAVHLKGRLPKTVEVDDLMQSGFEGLVQAMNTFDKTRNISLER